MLTSDKAFRPAPITAKPPVIEAQWKSDCGSNGDEALIAPSSLPVSNLFEIK